MENTLLIGDRVLVDRVSWRFSEPERTDIVVFHPPFDGPVLIKRIIGMPGDEVSLERRRGLHQRQEARRALRAQDRRPEPCPRNPSTTACRGRCRALHGAGRQLLRHGRQPHRQRRQPRVRAGDARASWWARPSLATGRRAASAALSRGSAAAAAAVNERFAFDLAAAGADGAAVAGADEAGRGCLAGPLVAAAVCLDYAELDEADLEALSGLDDSKRLTAPVARCCTREIVRRARQVVVVLCSPATHRSATACTAAISTALAAALERIDPAPDVRARRRLPPARLRAASTGRSSAATASPPPSPPPPSSPR